MMSFAEVSSEDETSTIQSRFSDDIDHHIRAPSSALTTVESKQCSADIENNSGGWRKGQSAFHAGIQNIAAQIPEITGGKREAPDPAVESS